MNIPPGFEQDCETLAALVKKYGMEDVLGMLGGIAVLYARDNEEPIIHGAYVVLDQALEAAAKEFAGRVP